jgi:hypothetical protein
MAPRNHLQFGGSPTFCLVSLGEWQRVAAEEEVTTDSAVVLNDFQVYESCITWKQEPLKKEASKGSFGKECH